MFFINLLTEKFYGFSAKVLPTCWIYKPGSAFKWVLPFYSLKWNRYFSTCKQKFLASTSTSQFSFSFASIFSAIKHNSPILFLARILYTLFKRSPLKCKFLKFLSPRVKIRQIPLLILNWRVNSSSNFASFFIVMAQNSPVNFKLIHFLFWTKGPH